MKFSVTVTLKKDVLDPQGKVVQNTLINMGMNNLENISRIFYFMKNNFMKNFFNILRKNILLVKKEFLF